MKSCVVSLLLLFTACGAPDRSTWDGAVHDSSGVHIVENGGRGLWSAATAWTVSEELSIGRVEGDAAYLFGRTADVAVDSRDRIHVLDAATRDVRTFDASGAFVQRLGRPGSGPGELSAFANAIVIGSGDTLYVPDYAQARINVYGPAGDYVREIRLRPRPGGRSWDRVDDGRFMFRGLTIGRDATGAFTTSDGLFVTSGENAPLDTILSFDYPASPLGAPGQPVVPLIVNAALWSRLADGRIAWTSLDRDEVLVADTRGRLVAIFRNATWVRAPIAERDRLQLKELLRRKLALIGGDAASVDHLQLVYDEALPAVTDLHGGPDGTLWVQRMSDAARIDPMAVNASEATGWLGGETWSVLDASGRLLGEVTMPGRVRITRITDEAVYGVRKGDADVETVVRLRLLRPTRQVSPASGQTRGTGSAHTHSRQGKTTRGAQRIETVQLVRIEDRPDRLLDRIEMGTQPELYGIHHAIRHRTCPLENRFQSLALIRPQTQGFVNRGALHWKPWGPHLAVRPGGQSPADHGARAEHEGEHDARLKSPTHRPPPNAFSISSIAGRSG